MSKLEILEMPDPRLRTVAKPVESFDDDLLQLVDDMIETMYDARGIGLAATQVNVHRRLLVLDVSEEQDSPRGPPSGRKDAFAPLESLLFRPSRCGQTEMSPFLFRVISGHPGSNTGRGISKI